MVDDTRLCPECGEQNPIRARFCLSCGTKLEPLKGPVVEEGERRTVTILFADLSGFTAFSEESDPEQVRALADQAAGRLGEIVERYGGTVDKIIGDCVMAVFGAPVSHENDPERGVRAALDMQDYVQANQERFARLQLTIGLNTGEAIWAPVGPDGRHTVLGDSVNTAARLQSAASRGMVLVGESTARLAEQAIEFEAVEPIKAKNKREPVPAFRAVRPKDAPTRRRTSRTPMVGRGAELTSLSELWERVHTESRPYLATVLGDAGVGKTRLVGALLERIGEVAEVYRGRCLDYGEGITYWPIVEIVEAAAGIKLSDETSVVSAKLGEFLEDIGSEDMDELRTMAAAVSNLVGAPTTPRGTYITTEISKGELHWGIRRVFELLARLRPVVLIIEDLHTAEPSLLELLDFFTQTRSRAAPILLLASGRPELATIAPEFLEVTATRRRLDLAPLGEDESLTLLAQIAGLEVDADGPFGLVLRSAAGNPLYLEETVAMLVDEGILGLDGELLGSLDDLRVPSTLQAMVETRLDRLSPVERRTAGYASVLGQVFWSGAIAHVGGDAGEIAEGLGGLCEREIVMRAEPSTFEGEEEYLFKHAMLRDVAYGRLTKSQRVDLHARAGGWIASRPGGQEDFVEIVAHHYEQACLLAQDVSGTSVTPPVIAAVEYLTKAAEKAEGREGTREADRFYERALTVVGDGYPETRVDLRLRRARTMMVLGQAEEASQELAAVAEVAPAFGRDDLRARSLINLADLNLAMGMISEAREHVEEAEQAARRVEDQRYLIGAAFVRSTILTYVDGDLEKAVDVLRDAIVIADEIGDRKLEIGARLRLGTLFYNAGELAQAETEFRAGADVAAQLGSIEHQTVAARVLGAIGYHRGPRPEAETTLVQALGWSERTANRATEAEILQTLASLALARGDFDAAEDRARRSLRMAPYGAQGAELNRLLAEVAYLRDRSDHARKAAAAARAVASDEDEYSRAVALVAEGFAAAAASDADTARERFETAIAALDEQGMATDAAEARIGFGRVLLRFGDQAAARTALGRALDVFLANGATATVTDVETLLAGTTEGASTAPSATPDPYGPS
jgi:class 3 adenylate cyclase/tetratricopeptide (TPR) repeat protein